MITPRRRASWVDADGRKKNFTPDPGWSYNPGRESFAWMADEDKPAPARAKPGQRTWQTYKLPDARKMPRTPVGEVLLNQRLLHHITEKPGDRRERYASRILPTLENPDEVWLTEYDNGMFRTRYMKFFQARKTILMIVEESELGVGPFHNLIPKRIRELNGSREGKLLYPKRPAES